MHQLTGDFYTVGEILGHTLKSIGMSLGISTNLEAVTAQYVDVRLERKKAVLETYHKALHPQKAIPEKDAASKDTPRKQKREAAEWSCEGRISLQLRAAFYMFLGNPGSIRASQEARKKP